MSLGEDPLSLGVESTDGCLVMSDPGRFASSAPNSRCLSVVGTDLWTLSPGMLFFTLCGTDAPVQPQRESGGEGTQSTCESMSLKRSSEERSEELFSPCVMLQL